MLGADLVPRRSAHPVLIRMNIRICNKNLNGLKLHEIPGRESLGVAPCLCLRCCEGGEVTLPAELLAELETALEAKLSSRHGHKTA